MISKFYNKKTIIFLLIIIILSITTYIYIKNKNSTNNNSIYKDISYSDISKTNTLDIYLPSNTNKPYPVVIWIHGGAFKMGNKNNPQSLNRLLSEGYAVVSVNYRLSSEAVWPAQLIDLQNIVKFIKNNSSKYNLDSNRIATWGASAGGFLSSIVGTALSMDENTKVKVAIDWYGPVDFSTMDEDIQKTGVERKTGENGAANSPESALLGFTVSENKEKVYDMSPLAYIEKATSSISKFLIMHGGQDAMIGAPQSERLRDAIVNKFGTSTVEYYFLPNGTHGGGDFSTTEAEDKVINFLKNNL